MRSRTRARLKACLRLYHLIPLLLQHTQQLIAVGAVTGFQGENNFHLMDGHLRAEPMVIYFQHVDALVGNDLQQPQQFARTISQQRVDGEETPRSRKAVLNEAADQVDVDVAAAERADNRVPLDIDEAAEQGRDANRARAFHQKLAAFQQEQDGVNDLLVVDEQDIINQLFDDWEGDVAGAFDGDAIGDGADGGQGDDLANIQRGAARTGAAGLHADDANVGLERFGRDGY